MNSITKSNLFYLGVLIILSFLLISVTEHYILTANFFALSGDPLSGLPGQEHAVYTSLQRWVYISGATYLLWKLFLISLIIYTATYLAGHQIGFGKILRVVILSEYLFLIPALIKIIWYLYTNPQGNFLDWQRLSIGSALNLVNFVTPEWYYPLQTINIFEVGYWFLLAFGLARSTGQTYDSALRIIMFSYVPALFVWMICVGFCTVMIAPSDY